jgi:hypothetical protein
MNCSNEILLQPAFELAAFALANLNLDRIRAGGLNFALRRITWSNDRVKKQPANRRACDRLRAAQAFNDLPKKKRASGNPSKIHF